MGHDLDARKARSLRQTDLAQLSGIAQADISRIERGQIAPTTPTLLKIAEALGAQIQFVLPAAEAEGRESRELVGLDVVGTDESGPQMIASAHGRR